MRRILCTIGLVGWSVVATAGGCKSNQAATEEPESENGGDSGSSNGGATNGGGSGSSKGGGTNGGGSSTSTNAGGSTAGGNKSNGGSGTGTSSNLSSASAGGSSVGGSGTATGTIGGSTAGGGSARGGAAGSSTGLGGTSTGGVATGGLWRGPTPATSKAKFPFPQNRQSPNCIYPKDYKNEDVQAVYDQWKADLVTGDGAGGFRRVKRPDEPGLEKNSTVSEGIAYGMIISVYMNDQALFDDLWKYSLAHASTAGSGNTQTILMNWYISPSGGLGSNPSGAGAATDADEDMAWALIMADKQWGGQGSLSKSYFDYAKQLLNDIWQFEILDGKLPKNGSGWGDWNNLNVSYFAPSYYRVFAKVSSNAAWGTDVVKCVYDTIAGNLTSANGNQSNGLVPAFSTATGGDAQVGPGQSAQPHNYQYDSCRTPFRIGLDACLFNDSNAKAYVAKTSQFFSTIGAANIQDGYELNGTPKPQWASRGYQGRSAAFIGPAGVGAMHSSSYQTFVDDVWGLVRQNNLWCGGQYYDESWTMLTMLMMSGNFLDYTVETPK